VSTEGRECHYLNLQGEEALTGKPRSKGLQTQRRAECHVPGVTGAENPKQDGALSSVHVSKEPASTGGKVTIRVESYKSLVTLLEAT